MITDNTGSNFQLHGSFEHLRKPRSSFTLTYQKVSIPELEKLIKSFVVSQGGKNENRD